MRAGLYQTKNGLLVFFGSLRSRKSTTLAEISSSTVFERSSVSGPSSLQVWFFEFRRTTCTQITGRGGVRQIVVFGIDGAGNLGQSGDRRILAGRRDALHRRRLVDVGEAHLLHGVEVIEIAPDTPGSHAPSAGRRCDRQDGSCRTRRCCSRDRAGTSRAPVCRAQIATGCPAAAAGSCRCGADTCR